ncbi:hypothetical protein SAMN05661096_03344 [Marivirga sericea]|uniref:Pirin family protein n=1 Tax=Marivirga sericea TaxID=1028 RepID=A0A1X7L176_9BACT|nr:pirin family protein [Marivirga sericea]SMG47042.1 hypothetical protein SAMN05661096_03344 [Marivirga sericea]
MSFEKINIAPRFDRPHSRNVMPSGYPKSIGPFIYFDHLGPYNFPKNRSVYIPPHPHAGITTISYMLAGEGNHKDSLGNALVLEPGRVNWMNAGNGIIHSEGTSETFSGQGGKLLGFQIWIMGSDNERSNEATFQTYSSKELPSIQSGKSTIHLIAGKYLERSSPVVTDQELLLMCIEAKQDDVDLVFDSTHEYLIYSLEGGFEAKETSFSTGEGLIVTNLETLRIKAVNEVKVVIAGGKPIETLPIFSGSLVAGSHDELQDYMDKLNTQGFGVL